MTIYKSPAQDFRVITNGTTYYTWIKYADDSSGSNMSDYPEDKSYIGIAYNQATATESTNASDYAWSLIQGSSGEDGDSLYTWIKYADDSAGTNMTDDPTDKMYIGIAYNQTTATESNNASDYTWSLFRGSNGVDGEDAAIASDTEPEDTSKLWLDTSETPPVLKQYVDYVTNDEDGETVTVQGWVAVNDQSEDIEELNATISKTFSDFTETSDAISSKVDEYKVSVDEVTGDITSLSQELSTLITQTSDGLEYKISQIDYGDTISDIVNKLEKYFIFTASGLTIRDGTDTNATSLTLDNGIIYFNKNDTTTTYWDGNESNFFVGNIYVQANEQARFGDFAWVPRADGHLSLIEVEDDE